MTRRILAIRLRRLGDILTTTPALRALRYAHPGARLDMLVGDGFDPAVRGNPHIDELLVLRRGLRPWWEFRRHCRRARYDLVVDLQGSPRSAACVLASGAPIRAGWRKGRLRDLVYNHRAEYRGDDYDGRKMLRVAHAAGVVPTGDARLDLALADSDRAHALRATRGLGRPLVAISAVARLSRKRWPAERYAALADRLVREAGASILLTYGPRERSQAAAVADRMHERGARLAGGGSVAHMAALFELADLWIGNDGGPKHVATAVGCPVVMIVGYPCRKPADLAELAGETWIAPPAPGGGICSIPVAPVWQAARAREPGAR